MKKLRLTQLKITTNNDFYNIKSPTNLRNNVELRGNSTNKTQKSFPYTISPPKKSNNFLNGSITSTNKLSLYSRKINNSSLNNENKQVVLSQIYNPEESELIDSVKSPNYQNRNEVSSPILQLFEKKNVKFALSPNNKESRNYKNEFGSQKLSNAPSNLKKKSNLSNFSSWNSEDLSKLTNSNNKIANLRLYSPTNVKNNTDSFSKPNSDEKFIDITKKKSSPLEKNNNTSISNIITTKNKIIKPNYNNYSSQNSEEITMTSIMGNQFIPISTSNLSVNYPFYETTKCSTKSNENIKAYAANTYQGIIRNYNEDRVSIILNISKPQNFKGLWPKCSFFSIYDGHGGSTCADFLRDNLHSYVIKDPNFPLNPREAIKNGFEQAEIDFCSQSFTKKFEIIDKSGSCAVTVLIIEDICYIANVGDSRALLSLNGGNNINALTNDHKPNEEGENKRIIENGGKIYQTQTPARLLNISNLDTNINNQIFIGPYRVFPGRLSVSRTFGDIEAKIPKFGGMAGVVVATPEITSFKISDDADFLMIGCDGIFDQLSNSDCVECVWTTLKDETITSNIHSQCALATDMIIKTSLVRRTLDNVTIVLIAFKNFERIFHQKQKNRNHSIHNNIENKEYLVTDPGSNYYSKTDINEQKDDTSSVTNQSGIVKRLKTMLDQDIIGVKFNSMSPKDSDKIIANKNNLNSNGPSYLNREKLNKVVSFEVNKKIIISPQRKKIKNLDYDYQKSKSIAIKFSDNKNIGNIFK